MEAAKGKDDQSKRVLFQEFKYGTPVEVTSTGKFRVNDVDRYGNVDRLIELLKKGDEKPDSDTSEERVEVSNSDVSSESDSEKSMKVVRKKFNRRVVCGGIRVHRRKMQMTKKGKGREPS